MSWSLFLTLLAGILIGSLLDDVAYLVRWAWARRRVKGDETDAMGADRP